jgi:predicted phosphodiesterase
MPLLIDERSAVQILRDLTRNYGDVAPANFARLVLGAHSEQARRLAGMAERNELPPPAADEENVTVTREIEGRELSISLKADKLPITSFDELVEFYEIDLKRWEPTSQLFNFWGSEANPNFQVKAAFREREYHALREEDRQAVRDRFAERAPTWERTEHGDRSGNLLEIVVSDLHADALTLNGAPLDERLAVVGAGIFSILYRARGLGVERIALVLLGDTFNHDGTGTTSNGTPQENLGDPRETYLKIRDWIAAVTDRLSRQAPVDLYLMEGNHDQERTFYALDSLAGHFRHHPNVTVNEDPVRAGIEWGDVLVGLWHGERQKNTDIAMTLLRDYPTQGKTVLEVHLGHEHTRREDEVNGVLLRRFRSPTSESVWADRRLMKHSVRSITGILWNRTRGEIANFPAMFREGT